MLNKVAGASSMPIGYEPPTLRQRLQAQLVQAEERVEALHTAIAALDAVPQLEALLDALGKVGIG